ncbi:hypothetical protein BOX15_Mlig023240g1 [Macrostomum lignano]|uniref:Uncharacterized protein n=1 Tax=Macrostomum lignano TaxID=282301 RepID=A0A267E8L9_9PLAT|nr:hypothetical protein BOX15_Mlig023240g1 [Macrostomum lignano]
MRHNSTCRIGLACLMAFLLCAGVTHCEMPDSEDMEDDSRDEEKRFDPLMMKKFDPLMMKKFDPLMMKKFDPLMMKKFDPLMMKRRFLRKLHRLHE